MGELSASPGASFRGGLGLLEGILAACGGTVGAPALIAPASLAVSAEPRGFEFDDVAHITLIPSRPAAIFYTTDGGEPTGPAARPYGGPIELRRSTYLHFIAQAGDGVWSPPAAELYTVRPKPPDPTPPMARVLDVEPESLFFTPGPSDSDPMTQPIVLRAAGPAPIAIAKVAIVPNPDGASFWDPAAFWLDGGPPLGSLPSGARWTVLVHFRPTDSFSSAVLAVDSDEERSGGHQRIPLWGRRIDW